ncbi:Uncharacterised protein [Paenibacillus macerans]|uniref:Uncharacterized protein n=1 Tax=Paenibacillus macerans TaxID=44252 RepID=A0A090Y9T3_PAEMA|nr:hypothetical protein DJ90_5852 [Paenibacillus macerans]SUD26035.1 Uncharacterised protein [Paenibacillus macerans]
MFILVTFAVGFLFSSYKETIVAHTPNYFRDLSTYLNSAIINFVKVFLLI